MKFQIAYGYGMQANNSAQYDSYGFFESIPDELWRRKKKAHIAQMKVQGRSGERPFRSGRWYQENWEPTFSCPAPERIGQRGDGGKWVCGLDLMCKSRGSNKTCLVYSIGSNNDFGFEEAVYKRLKTVGCEPDIHTFDPTVGAHPSRKPKFVNFHAWGLGARGRANYFSLDDMKRKLHHDTRTIEILKMDCEGCEFAEDVYSAMFPPSQGDFVPVRQVLVEIHKGTTTLTKNRLPQAEVLFQYATRNGFVMTHKEPNIQFPMGHAEYAVEFAFLKLRPESFNVEGR